MPKNGKAARPKFHVLFEIKPVTSAAEYADIIERSIRYFPWFDACAKDGARFFFGTEDPRAKVYDAPYQLTEFLYALAPGAVAQNITAPLPVGASRAPGVPSPHAPLQPDWKNMAVIPQGQRNNTLFRIATNLLVFHGDIPKARRLYENSARLCQPPLPQSEVEDIWNSARKHAEKARAKEGYLPKEEYLQKVEPQIALPPTEYRPADPSDVGQANMLAEHFLRKLRWCAQTGFLRYEDGRWQSCETAAMAASRDLTDLQKEESEQLLIHADALLKSVGAAQYKSWKEERAFSVMTPVQKQAYLAWKDAQSYADYVAVRRSHARLRAAVETAMPLIQVDAKMLDRDPFLLNTPAGTIDLRSEDMLPAPHDPDDFITKMTAAAPEEDEDGGKIWRGALKSFFNKDEELIAYVQRLCGLMLIGKVFSELLIIAYGDGSNGKSSFFNVIRRVMGDYAGTIASDVLLADTKRNTKPEMASLRGLRLALASELPENRPLSEEVVKQLCSTDDIRGEAKYCAPISFAPSHTLVLMTNHMPKVRGMDKGIWRRICPIPFTATFEGDSDVKNFADILFDQAAGSILYWMLKGARLVLDDGGAVGDPPPCVQALIDEYHRENDPVAQFLEDCCARDEEGVVSSSDLYKSYELWCAAAGIRPMASTGFGKHVKRLGSEALKKNGLRYYKGLRVLPLSPFLE